MENTIAAPVAPSGSSAVKPEIKIPTPKKKRKWLKVLIVLALVALLIFFLFLRPMMAASRQINDLLYTQGTAEYRDVTVSVSGTATVQPVDSYRVTALVRGEILSAPFEEGDRVEEGDLLYQIDAGDVESTIQRSEIAVEQARLSYQSLLDTQEDTRENLDVKASESGVISKLYVDAGDTLTAGSPIADIVDRETMKLTLTFHSADASGFFPGQAAAVQVSGTGEVLSGSVDSIAPVEQVGPGGTLVREVTILVQNPGALSPGTAGTATVGGADCAAAGTFQNAAGATVVARTSGKLEALYVSEGDRVRKDQLLGAFESSDMATQIENARLSLRSAELSLQSAQDQLENYAITSPISGTVIEKNYKAGDNLDTAAAGYLAVIYDMSGLTFDMRVDELYINQIRVGQQVRITADALEGQDFTGTVSKININGTTLNGVTTYPVTVDIDHRGELLPGMNISAEILVEHAQHVLTVPVEMVGRGNIVQVLPSDAFDKDGKPDYTRLEQRSVTLGRNDDSYIEILSGLSEGETVVYKTEASTLFEQMMGGAAGGRAGMTVTAP